MSFFFVGKTIKIPYIFGIRTISMDQLDFKIYKIPTLKNFMKNSHIYYSV